MSKKNDSREEIENLEEKRRKKQIKRNKQKEIEESVFDEALEEIDDDDLYTILKKLKD